MRFSLRCEGDGNLRAEVTIVVDVANVMGSRPDGWWRDRAGAAVRLHAQIARLAASGRAILPPGDRPGSPGEDAPAFVLVLEGAARAAISRLPAARPTAGATAASAGATAGGAGAGADGATGAAGTADAAGPARPGEVRVVEARGSGDDAIVAVVRELPGRRVVVTADRELRARCVAAGAEILGPGWLLGLL
jgi:8-oxo-dGTP diphosphatase